MSTICGIDASSSCTGNSATATRLIHVGNVNYTNSASIQGNGIWQYSDTSTSNRPMDYGTILQFSNVDNPIPGTNQHWVTQLWSSTYATLKYRARTNTGSWSNFYTILDSNNYSSFCLPLSGGTMTGSLLSSNWTNKLGSSAGGFHELWLGGATSADMEYNTTNNN